MKDFWASQLSYGPIEQAISIIRLRTCFPFAFTDGEHIACHEFAICGYPEVVFFSTFLFVNAQVIA
jgi:hypothetical protein